MLIHDFERYAKTLGLEWEVIYQPTGVLGGSSVLTDQTAKKHILLLSQTFDWLDEKYRADGVHGLCACKIAERFDPILVRPAAAQSISHLEVFVDFPDLNGIVRFLTFHNFIWANDIFHEKFPELYPKAFELQLYVARLANRKGRTDLLDTHEWVSLLAAYRAEASRYGFEPEKTTMVSSHLSNTRKIHLGQLTTLYEKLPRLTDDLAMNLSMHEAVTQQAMEILGYTETAKINVVEGNRVWEFA